MPRACVFVTALLSMYTVPSSPENSVYAVGIDVNGRSTPRVPTNMRTEREKAG